MPEDDVVGQFASTDLRAARGWLQIVRFVVGRQPDVIGDLEHLRQHLNEVADCMPERDPDPMVVMSLRFGLEGDAPMSLQDVAMRLGYTRERIRLVENEVLRRLRYPRYSASMKALFYLDPLGPDTRESEHRQPYTPS